MTLEAPCTPDDGGEQTDADCDYDTIAHHYNYVFHPCCSMKAKAVKNAATL